MNDNDSDRNWFADQMEGLGLTYDKEVTAPLCEIYFRALMPYERRAIERAIAQVILGSKFFPKPAELIELISGSPDDRAMAAWNLLEEARAKVGYFNSLWVSDPALSQALTETFGGWVSYCESMHQVRDSETGKQIGGLSPEMSRAKQKEFVVNFRRATIAPRPSSPYHVGKCELENRNNVSGWKRGMFPDGLFTQPLGIMHGNEVALIPAPFDASTAQLTDGARAMLEAGNVGALIAASPAQRALQAREVKRLSSGPDEPAPEEVGRLLKLVPSNRIFKPSDMSEEEKDRRMAELRRQAEMLKAESEVNV